MDCNFHPLEAELQFHQRQQRSIKWPLGKGGPISSSGESSIVAVVGGDVKASASDVWVRDPELFVAGEPHRHLNIWDMLTRDHTQRDLLLGWIKTGIPVIQFIVPFKGKYRQEQFNHLLPPTKSANFIATKTRERSNKR